MIFTIIAIDLNEIEITVVVAVVILVVLPDEPKQINEKIGPNRTALTDAPFYV